MSFIDEIRQITKVNEGKFRTYGTKRIIKEIKKQIKQAAKEGEYEIAYHIPHDLLFYKNDVENYFTKERFTCRFYTRWRNDVISVSWKGGNSNDNY